MRRFPEYAEIGRGCGRLLAFGGFDLDAAGSKKLLPGGVLVDGQTSSIEPDKIAEFVQHSRYRPANGRHPSTGETEPDAQKPDAYSWVKSPRYAQTGVRSGAAGTDVDRGLLSARNFCTGSTAWPGPRRLRGLPVNG